jgi:hypothetical protein
LFHQQAGKGHFYLSGLKRSIFDLPFHAQKIICIPKVAGEAIFHPSYLFFFFMLPSVCMSIFLPKTFYICKSKNMLHGMKKKKDSLFLFMLVKQSIFVCLLPSVCKISPSLLLTFGDGKGGKSGQK